MTTERFLTLRAPVTARRMAEAATTLLESLERPACARQLPVQRRRIWRAPCSAVWQPGKRPWRSSILSPRTIL
jgi:hypothetical protein